MQLFSHTNVFRIVIGAQKNFFFCGAAAQHGLWPPHSWGF